MKFLALSMLTILASTAAFADVQASSPCEKAALAQAQIMMKDIASGPQTLWEISENAKVVFISIHAEDLVSRTNPAGDVDLTIGVDSSDASCKVNGYSDVAVFDTNG